MQNNHLPPYGTNVWNNPEHYQKLIHQPLYTNTTPFSAINMNGGLNSSSTTSPQNTNTTTQSRLVSTPLSQGDTLHQVTLCDVNVLQESTSEVIQSVSCSMNSGPDSFQIKIKSLDVSRPCVVTPTRTCCEIKENVDIAGAKQITAYVDYDITIPILVSVPGESTCPSFCKTSTSVTFSNIFESSDIKSCGSSIEKASGSCEPNTFIVQNDGQTIVGLFKFSVSLETFATVNKLQVVQKA